jgi:ATP-dependent Lhr-like helicase
MEADDLMAALFPSAAACQENVTGPIEIPDHPLVRQTVHDTLTEGLDVDGLVDLWRSIESGDVTLHGCDTTEPSLLAHEILTARPYAFLDDGEAVDRRTNAVSLRRGLPVDPATMGRLQPAAIDQVRDETTPRPTTPDELHDLLAALVLTAARPEWTELFAELEGRGRAVRRTDASGERWHTTEVTPAVAVLLDEPSPGEHPTDDRPDTPAADDVAADLLRGHLELHSPTTVVDLAAATGLAPGAVTIGLARLENEGFALQGRFSDPDLTDVEWSSRRLLARMHSYSRRNRRREIEPVTPEQLVRFWLRWQHVAPGSQVRGRAGLGAVLEQLQGASAAVAAWEPDLLARRVADYEPAWLDERCLAGELSWLRLVPPTLDDPDKRGGGPSKATPVSLAFRGDLPWLLAAVRGADPAPVPAAGAVAEIVAVLAARGACFAAELAEHTGRLATEIEGAVWEAVARGLITSDGFDAIRSLTRGDRRPTARDRQLSRLRRGAPPAGRSAGRWSLVPEASAVVGDDGAGDDALDREDLAEALADQLLARWGVVFYDIAAHEGAAMRWRDLQWALRRMEDRGQVRGGRFVNGFSGEQFALRSAVDGLKAVRRLDPSETTVTVSGADPLNVTGVILPGERIPARRTESVELPL